MKLIRDVIYIILKIPFILLGIVIAFVVATTMRGMKIMDIINDFMERT